MWDLMVSVPDHCLSFYFNRCLGTDRFIFRRGWGGERVSSRFCFYFPPIENQIIFFSQSENQNIFFRTTQNMCFFFLNSIYARNVFV